MTAIFSKLNVGHHTTLVRASNIAPEVIRRKPYGKPVDLWSIGVITFLLLSGDMPFRAADDGDTLTLFDLIAHGRYAYLDENWDQCSKESIRFIDKLLVVHPDERMTADDALNNEWLRIQRMNDILPIFQKNYKAKRRLKKIGYAVMAVEKLSLIRDAAILAETSTIVRDGENESPDSFIE
jgi:serine/threonine protein kinase